MHVHIHRGEQERERVCVYVGVDVVVPSLPRPNVDREGWVQHLSLGGNVYINECIVFTYVSL